MMKKYQTEIISKEEMKKYLEDCGIVNPINIMTEAIKSKTSIYIPKINALLAWIYKGETLWNFHGGNSDNVDDYSYQIMPR